MYPTFTYMYFCFVTMSCICLSLIKLLFCSVTNLCVQDIFFLSSLIQFVMEMYQTNQNDTYFTFFFFDVHSDQCSMHTRRIVWHTILISNATIFSKIYFTIKYCNSPEN